MKRILIQFDTDAQPSVFDRVVAVDADVDHLFSYGGVTPETVVPLVHGAMFTRGPHELHHTAIFIGGSDVAAGEAVLQAVRKTLFDPLRVSVMLDANGCNTTAAAAVLSARKHLELKDCTALVLAGTGPVGQRAAHLLAQEGARVRVGSRTQGRAEKTCALLRETVPGASVQPCATAQRESLEAACQDVALIIAAGAAGVELLPFDLRAALPALRVVIDLNAVPPVGVAGVEVLDKGVERQGVVCYGAIGVGGRKMKIHKAAIRSLFEKNSRVLDTAAIYELGVQLG